MSDIRSFHDIYMFLWWGKGKGVRIFTIYLSIPPRMIEQDRGGERPLRYLEISN
jgi:hypothetical protein